MASDPEEFEPYNLTIDGRSGWITIVAKVVVDDDVDGEQRRVFREQNGNVSIYGRLGDGKGRQLLRINDPRGELRHLLTPDGYYEAMRKLGLRTD